ncbi:hypothetical protein CEXT_569661 [Caerostris extrusa]|uniref:Uncharacterized protein n=1 Tax=Caerostris extrusa TaxID=172846 RepID=A0AAV4XSZ2_CAEEX|nr:hypothetical protein CEXT_569661 [Caerostris extrusa]
MVGVDEGVNTYIQSLPSDRKTLTETNNEQEGGGRESEILDSPPSGGSDYFINFYHLLCFQGLHSQETQSMDHVKEDE